MIIDENKLISKYLNSKPISQQLLSNSQHPKPNSRYLTSTEPINQLFLYHVQYKH